MDTIIIIAVLITAVILLFALWMISLQRRLVVLDENTGNAMSQLGVQLSSRFDVLTSLVDLIKGYAPQEGEKLREFIKTNRVVITAKSTPSQVIEQEVIILQALNEIAVVAQQHIELEQNEHYKKNMDAAETFDNMVRTSKLIYNDSAAKYNGVIRQFPLSLLAGIFGFRQREIN